MNGRSWGWACAALAAAALGGCTTSGAPAPVEVFDPISREETEVVIDPSQPIRRPQQYTVVPGDTLAEVALRFGLDYREVARWNLITDPNRIEVGQQLKLVPPRYEPEIRPALELQQQQQAPVRPQLRRTTESEALAIREAPVPAADSEAPSVRRRQTIIGKRTELPDEKPRLLISTPQALKLPYTEQALASMLGRSIEAAPASLPAVSAPSATRQQAGITWSWPTVGTVAKGFGEGSNGMVLSAERGTPVHASADGEVYYAGSAVEGFGQLVVVKHANEYISVYAHNDTIFVAQGDRVERGHTLATMGATGARAVGLRFQIGRGAERFDPLDFLPESP